MFHLNRESVREEIRRKRLFSARIMSGLMCGDPFIPTDMGKMVTSQIIQMGLMVRQLMGVKSKDYENIGNSNYALIIGGNSK